MKTNRFLPLYLLTGILIFTTFYFFYINESLPINIDNPSLAVKKNENPPHLSSQDGGREMRKSLFSSNSTVKKLKGIVTKSVSSLPEMAPFKKLTHEERANEAFELERLRTLDPALGYVPEERRQKAIEQTFRMQQTLYGQGILRSSLQKAKWIERGPGNVGGRTKAILVDLSDPTGNTVFAGGVTGGLFKTTNIVSSQQKWAKVNDWLSNLTISSIAQDTRNPKIMYIGTGDSDGNDSRGNGIYKSVDGGKTWNVLSSTTNGDFSTVSTLVVTPDSGHILAATFAGVFKSKDEGATWYKVLGSGFRYGNTGDKFYNLQRASDGRFYACNATRVFKSTALGEAGTWENISLTANNFPSNWTRVEIGVAPSDPNVVYAVGSVSNRGTAIYRTSDGGNTWTATSKPSWRDGCGATPSDADFTRGQAWYDLVLMVQPNDPNIVYVGGVDFHRSNNGGQSWTQLTIWTGNCGSIQYAHADQHGALFDPRNPNILYIGTDGGVFRIDNPSTSTFQVQEKTDGFITTQFYACAIHPDSAVNHFMAGAQDNGTLIVRSQGVGNVNGRSIGGDGFMCFIDKNEPNIQIGALYYGTWYLSTDGGSSFGSGARANGGFFCPADYDSKNNILYAQSNNGELWRWRVGKDNGLLLAVDNIGITNISHITVDENKDNRIYIGTYQGRVYRVDNANSSDITLADGASIGLFTGAVSSIAIAKGDTNHIVVTLSSYGVPSVMESLNGGQTWTNIEGNLPDMPIRWALFDPTDGNKMMLATEGGVWSTNQLNGKETVWYPPYPTRGTPIVRTDMLRVRTSDNTVLAATYGRGMWTSSALGEPKAVIDYSGVSYVGATTLFTGEYSSAAESYNWSFGDGSTDTLENSSHVYNQIGTYNVSLKINGDDKIVSNKSIKILPALGTPYKSNTSGYLGSFEKTDEHFGAYTSSGSKFEKGKSVIIGKAGTNSGANAYVLGLKEQFYQKNTTAYLYLPMFDMTQKGIYQFSFWTMYDIQKGYDGMQVEYSLDKGRTWQTVGSSDDPYWYDYKNTTVRGGAFPIGTAYFSGQLDDWKRFKVNISALAGNPNVAFRFVFKSDAEGSGAGVAIDDIEISKYEGELRTAIVSQAGAYTSSQTSINAIFKTQPEYSAKTFELEMSDNGRTYKKVATFKAKGISTDELSEYSAKIDGTPFDIYYFRVKAINEDIATNYKLEFYSDPFVVRRSKDAAIVVNKVFPSPFKDNIGVLFTDIVKENVNFELYDMAGRIVGSEKLIPNGVYHELSIPNLPKGMYLLKVQMGTAPPVSFKLFGGN